MKMETMQLRDLQLIELDMLKEVLKVITKYNFTYYALGGTLLGAVRHKGFIPWDDDIDIGIPRPDYEKFLSVAPKELPNYLHAEYFKTERSNGVSRPVYACQIRNQRIKIIQKISNKPIYTNAWIDVFPLDGMPSNFIVRMMHATMLLYRRLRIQYSMFDENVHQLRKNRPWFEKILIKLYCATHIGSSDDPYEMMDKIDKELKKYNYDECNYLINFMGAWKLKEQFPKSVYGVGKDYSFEDITIRGPEREDIVLTQMYGDYMVPITNKNDRYDHHAIEYMSN